MGTITATCGHVLTEAEEFGHLIQVKAHARDGSKAVDHLTVCTRCRDEWREEGDLLKSKEEADQWMASGNPPDMPR